MSKPTFPRQPSDLPYLLLKEFEHRFPDVFTQPRENNLYDCSNWSLAKILQVQTNIFKHKKLAGGQCSVTVAAEF
ncbi:hypothetical protein [Aeribacillus pallidus]|uniref:hypothetical protein n=1 Tax=Aeribacillus pallidus TaxID=33936 RepID=UPI0012FDB54B|nr:hypothetical protein [Aeribacillus pallidus]